MAGTPQGGKRAAQTTKERYGEDFYQKIGKLANEAWEKNGRKPRGFAHPSADPRAAGHKGGTKSRKGEKS